MNTLNNAARRLMQVRETIAELEAEAERLADEIKAAMVENGNETIFGDGWKATWKNVNSSRFDSKAFREDHAELYARYTKAMTTTRFVFCA